jgi:hypothetical protein
VHLVFDQNVKAPGDVDRTWQSDLGPSVGFLLTPAHKGPKASHSGKAFFLIDCACGLLQSSCPLTPTPRRARSL